MADDQQQTQDTDQEQDEQRDDTAKEPTPDARGDQDGDERGADKLLRALKEERERANKAERELKRIDRERRDAETARAVKAGEWESVARVKDGEIADLQTRIVGLETQIAERDTALLRAQVAAKYQLPDRMVDRLRGATAEELEEDAKELVKLVVKRNGPNTEAGRNGATPKTPTLEQEKQAQLATGRYRSIA